MVFEVDIDCTACCSLLKHGNLLTKALTKREINEESLIKYLVVNCGNFSKVLDENGRSCLHLCCSSSKPEVAEFLIRQGANINQKDTEMNWTPLHRAINYACLDVAVLLKRYGASFDIFDSDYFTPLQMIHQTRHEKLDKIDLQAVVWGRNKNYNLGIGNITTKEIPDILKGLPNIKTASINKFHSLFLSNDSKLYGCGHSKEGRLGVGESTLTQPQPIAVKLNYKHETIIDVAVGMSHSLILTNKSIYGTGSNKYYQLGMETVESVLGFKEIPFDRTEVDMRIMFKIIACDFHSLFISKAGVYVCGLNVGQFNGIQESILVPRKMPYPQLPNSEILWTSSNNACICIYLKDRNSHYLHIFCNRKMKTYKNPLNERLKQCTMYGGELLYNNDDVVKNSSQKPLTVFFLTEHNNLFIWYEDIMQFTKVHVSPSFLVQITSIIACNDDLLIHANQHLFKAAIQHKVPKMYQVDSEYKELKLKRDIAQFLCAKVSIKRLSNLANVEKVFCDPDGESFIALLGQSCVKIEEPEKAFYNFTELLDADMFAGSRILDVKFILKNQEFHTNRFLVASRCEHLKNMMKNGEFEIIDEKMTSEMFQCILTWIYKENLDDDDLESIIGRVKDEELIKNLLKDFYDILMEWKLYQVLNSLKKKFQKYFTKSENDFNNSSPAFKWFNIENFPELYDVTIQLEDNQILRAHKVILMMRIEYFKMMFYHTWSEESVVDLKHVPIIYMRPIIQFAYDNNIQALSDSNFSDIFLYNMCTILDQYLIEDLKNVFETIIIRKVNLKNCAENLDFSITYNCHKLKEHCMSFICLNLPRILESGVLDILDISTLRELNIFYRKFYNFETKSNHILTPAFDAPTDEEIELKIEGFDLIAYCAAAEHQATLKKTPKSKSRLSKSEMSKRNYEKEGMKTLKSEETSTTVASPKSTAIDIIVRDEIDVSSSSDNIGTWQKKIRERKDSGRKKGLTASKVNEIVKNEVIQSEQMVDLKSLRKSISEDVEIIDSSPRNAITLADFCVKSKKKEILTPQKVEILETKPKLAWNMDNIELKPSNSQNSAELFKSSTPPKKKSLFPSPKPQKSIEKNFNSIIRDERKEKTNYEKIKSKSLILTQIEEQAIIELSQFYNIDNIFDESITIERKVHKASQNLSQWTHHQTTNGA